MRSMYKELRDSCSGDVLMNHVISMSYDVLMNHVISMSYDMLMNHVGALLLLAQLRSAIL